MTRTTPGGDPGSAFLARLRDDDPLLSVELRPPGLGMDYGESLDAWIDLHHQIRRLSRRDTAVFLTDDAVGTREEENLRHLTTNLVGDVRLSRMVPFLTAKHSLEYCLQFAQRAGANGRGKLGVLGGSREVGPPRWVDHGYPLRERIRARVPGLTLGGWANPHADPERQVEYLLEDRFTAEFFLTQVVSHHDMGPVDRFLEAARRRGVPYPAVFGVFYYRSATPETLDRLSRFFPVPAEGLEREFGQEGATPAEVCARTIRALRDRGVDAVYVSNLDVPSADAELERIRSAITPTAPA
jgi:hypothetical protein